MWVRCQIEETEMAMACEEDAFDGDFRGNCQQVMCGGIGKKICAFGIHFAYGISAKVREFSSFLFLTPSKSSSVIIIRGGPSPKHLGQLVHIFVSQNFKQIVEFLWGFGNL
jgi:hypothetical protein